MNAHSILRVRTGVYRGVTRLGDPFSSSIDFWNCIQNSTESLYFCTSSHTYGVSFLITKLLLLRQNTTSQKHSTDSSAHDDRANDAFRAIVSRACFHFLQTFSCSSWLKIKRVYPSAITIFHILDPLCRLYVRIRNVEFPLDCVNELVFYTFTLNPYVTYFALVM